MTSEIKQNKYVKGSSKLMREQAELAFDEVFYRPLGSRELAGA
ncbi:MAG: hypothetical protein SCH71_16030 [Desulfobulbaceae bacterium]|nr:hypothetical protein [Desulfobulbaceae bacterium]